MFIVEQISSSSEVINHEYTYSGGYGVHTINVRGFNLANNDTISTDVEVLEWPCQPPTVTFDVDPEVTLVAENKDGFTVIASIAVDCMKSDDYTAQWDLVDSNQILQRRLTNATQLIMEPYSLPAGIYFLNVTVSLQSGYFNLSNHTVSVSFCVNITSSELVTGIDGSGFVSVRFNETVKLSAFNRTHDASALSKADKSEMHAKWHCKRSGEDWPVAPMPTQSYLPYSGANGGCFDNVGPLSVMIALSVKIAGEFQTVSVPGRW